MRMWLENSEIREGGQTDNRTGVRSMAAAVSGRGRFTAQSWDQGLSRRGTTGRQAAAMVVVAELRLTACHGIEPV